jgi:hypothetical protein
LIIIFWVVTKVLGDFGTYIFRRKPLKKGGRISTVGGNGGPLKTAYSIPSATELTLWSSCRVEFAQNGLQDLGVHLPCILQ